MTTRLPFLHAGLNGDIYCFVPRREGDAVSHFARLLRAMKKQYILQDKPEQPHGFYRYFLPMDVHIRLQLERVHKAVRDERTHWRL